MSVEGWDIGVVIAASGVIGGATVLLASLRANTGSSARATRYLAAIILACLLSSTGDLCLSLHLFNALRWVDPFASAALFLLGPAVLLYTREVVLQQGDPPRAASFWHWVPALLVACVGLLAGLAFENPPADPPPPVRAVSDLILLVPVAVQMFAYLFVVIRIIWRLRSEVETEYSSLEGRTLRWVMLLAVLFGLILLFWVVSWGWPIALSNFATNALLGLALAVVAAKGLSQRRLFAAGNDVDTEPSADVPPDATPKYARSGLSAELAATLVTRLDALMQLDKAYLESDLTLRELAQRAGATPHQISQVLSQSLQRSFFDYVNGFRVEAVKLTLERPQSGDRPLLEIALECGFGSKSSFNDTFRRLTGMSPSAYRATRRAL